MLDELTVAKFNSNLIESPINPGAIHTFTGFAEQNPNFVDGGDGVISLVASSPFFIWVPVCTNEFVVNPETREGEFVHRIAGFKGIPVIGADNTFLLLDNPATNRAYQKWLLTGEKQINPFENSEWYQIHTPIFYEDDLENALRQKHTLIQNAVIGLAKTPQIGRGQLPHSEFDGATPNSRYINTITKINIEGRATEVLEIDILTGKITVKEKLGEDWFETPLGEIDRFGMVHIDLGEEKKYVYTIWELARKGENKPGIEEVRNQVETFYNSSDKLPEEIRIPTKYLLDESTESSDSKTLDYIIAKLRKDYHTGRDYEIHLCMSANMDTMDIVLTRK